MRLGQIVQKDVDSLFALRRVGGEREPERVVDAAAVEDAELRGRR
jgi:hypothetical protein